MRQPGEAWGLLDLAIGLASYAALYGLAAWLLLLSRAERSRLITGIRSKSGLREGIAASKKSD
jgi:hypothetical protein